MSIERALGLTAGDYKNYRPEYVYGLRKGVMTQHARPSYVNNCIDTYTRDTYYKFTIVRNPWDRMVSCYYYLYNINKNKYGNFSTWLKNAHNIVTSRLYREGDHLTPQIEYTHDSNGSQIVDMIGRYEQLQDSYESLCDKLKIKKTSLQLINRSGNRPGVQFDSMYNTHDRNLVFEMYKQEIKLFDYEFI